MANTPCPHFRALQINWHECKYSQLHVEYYREHDGSVFALLMLICLQIGVESCSGFLFLFFLFFFLSWESAQAWLRLFGSVYGAVVCFLWSVFERSTYYWRQTNEFVAPKLSHPTFKNIHSVFSLFKPEFVCFIRQTTLSGFINGNYWMYSIWEH